MTTFVFLFRGINVGGHQKVRMDELKELHVSLGFRDVVSYIQSGNIVCTSDDADTAQVQKCIEDGFGKRFGFRVGVVVRTSTELKEIIEKNPFSESTRQRVKMGCRAVSGNSSHRSSMGRTSQDVCWPGGTFLTRSRSVYLLS